MGFWGCSGARGFLRRVAGRGHGTVAISGAQRGGEIGGAISGAQRGSEIGKWETGRITVKKQEISQNDRKKWKILERIKGKLRKLRAKGGENLWNDRKI